MPLALRERWRTILEFPNYEISDKGNIYNLQRQRMMRVSQNNYGHSKITLTDYDGSRHTRSVALLVAEAFVEPPNILCDTLIVLDGNLANVNFTNLDWRPRGFSWNYTRQLKTDQPVHYQNLPVANIVTGYVYDSIIEAGMKEGLLFDDIWRSTYSGEQVYPTGAIFEILERV